MVYTPSKYKVRTPISGHRRSSSYGSSSDHRFPPAAAAAAAAAHPESTIEGGGVCRDANYFGTRFGPGIGFFLPAAGRETEGAAAASAAGDQPPMSPLRRSFSGMFYGEQPGSGGGGDPRLSSVPGVVGGQQQPLYHPDYLPPMPPHLAEPYPQGYYCELLLIA